MKLKLIVFAMALVVGGAMNAMQPRGGGNGRAFEAHALDDNNGGFRSGDVLAGVATGLLGRLTSYALKDQGGVSTQGSLVGAAFLGLVATYAWQSNDPRGSFNRGVTQLVSALATYVVSMYIVPSKEKQEQEVARATLTVARPA